MAYQSYYWKRAMKRDARFLLRKCTLSHADIENDIDKHVSDVEIKVMTLAYAARKLADTHKLPDLTLKRKTTIRVYPRIKHSRRSALMKPEAEYNLNSPRAGTLELRQLCNQIIHSYLLEAVGSPRRAFKAIWVVSDRRKDVGLYEIDLKRFCQLMLRIADSHVSRTHWRFDEGRNAWMIENR